LTIKRIDFAGSTLSLQSVDTSSEFSSSGFKTAGSSRASSAGIRSNSEKYTTRSSQSAILINDSDGLAKSNSLSMRSRRSAGLVDLSSPSSTSTSMTSVLSAGGMESLYDKMRLEYASAGRGISQIEIGDVETVSSDTSGASASDVSTIYEDVISSNMLMNRGFDPTRAAIIGSFEFIPISDEVETNDEALLYDFVPTTCLLLADMQSIAQQARLSTASSIIYRLGAVPSDGDIDVSADMSDYSDMISVSE